MAFDQEAAKQVLAQIDRDELAQLACDLTSIPSPTGQEKAIAEFILAYRASIWTDTNVYNELGIPAIKIGPRGRRISARNEEIEIDAMVKAAQLYALIALDICSRERPRTG